MTQNVVTVRPDGADAKPLRSGQLDYTGCVLASSLWIGCKGAPPVYVPEGRWGTPGPFCWGSPGRSKSTSPPSSAWWTGGGNRPHVINVVKDPLCVAARSCPGFLCPVERGSSAAGRTLSVPNALTALCTPQLPGSLFGQWIADCDAKRVSDSAVGRHHGNTDSGRVGD